MIEREKIDPRTLLAQAHWPAAIYSRKERCWIDETGMPTGEIMDAQSAPRFPLALAYGITHNYLHSIKICDILTLDLPMPPSTNALYVEAAGKVKGKGRQRVKTKDYRAWLEHTSWTVPQQLRAQGFPASPQKPIITRPFGITITVRLSHHGDVTNRIKALEDFLVAKKITDGDQWCNRAEVERTPELPAECRVTAYHRSWD